MELRRKRRSYADIREILRIQYDVIASRSTINSFVKCRQKLLRRGVGIGPGPTIPTKLQLGVSLDTVESNEHLPMEAKRAPYDAIEALRRKPVATPVRNVFKFDETKPLTLPPNKSS